MVDILLPRPLPGAMGEPSKRPLPAAGVAGPGVARRLPQVRRVRAAPGRDLHMLPARRQGLLQTGLQQALRHQVRPVPGGVQQQRPGNARPRPRLPPGVLPLRRLRPPAPARRPILPAGARPALPRRPRAAPRRRRRPRTAQPRAAAGRAPRRAGARAAACPAAAGAQGGGEDHPRADGAEREAAAHAADLLRRQPAPRRPDEGAACGNDGAQSPRHPRLVPEQALQGQEKVHPHEAAPAAAAQRQDEPAGPHRDAAGGREPHPPRERRAGQRRGGPDLSTTLEGAQRVRPAERSGAARRLPAAGEPRRAVRRAAGDGQIPARRARALRKGDGAGGDLAGTSPPLLPQVSFSESGSLGTSSGSDVTSLSSQLPDTPNSMVPSPAET
ncbi:insulin gene enhancer protein ISL-2 isoform X2 [Prinia subflava]|uniref:insulin gene enhancer protein ISL-2 isoform X2 n=1 Tax=Prinia subflava TaxID=208062 RepID=UPI002FE2ECD7